MPTTPPNSQNLPTTDPMHQSLVLPQEGCCFHCGEVLPKSPFFSEVLGEARPMCCLGCKLAADSIVEANLSQYYLDRQKISRVASLPNAINFDIYNHQDIKASFTYNENDQMVAELSVVGLRCAACTWLIQSRLAVMNGVGHCSINLTDQRMRVSWQEDKISIGEILHAIYAIGYEALPYRTDTHEARLQQHNKKLLIRLGVAAIGAMQAMMFSVGLYFGEYSGMDLSHRDFLRQVAMIVSVPVVFYAGVPFFVSAKNALKARTVNMDIPVSIAILITFFASVYAFISQSGETYFDSVAMFVFFLLAGRYLEHNARLKAANMASDLLTVNPKLMSKLTHNMALLAVFDAFANGENNSNCNTNNQHSPNDITQMLSNAEQLRDYAITNYRNFGEFIEDNYQAILDNLAQHSSDESDNSNLIHDAKAGDIVKVGAGEEIICDGILLSGYANVSQSLLTGEGDLIGKKCGDVLLGGSQNDAMPLVMFVSKDRQNSQLALIDRLIHRASSEKPQIAVDADRMAKWFISRVLVLALVVFGVWWYIEPTQAIWATVAVLVATCPCALSLATPIALTVSTNRLAQKKFLATRGHTLPTLANITHVAFDKTGTLTTGTPTLLAIETCGDPQGNLSHQESQSLQEQYHAIAAALETDSRHPVARSLVGSAKQLHLPKVSEVVHTTGGGVEAVVFGQRWRIGHRNFAVEAKSDSDVVSPNLSQYNANMAVVLSVFGEGRWQVAAWFYFNDALRRDTQAVIDTLKQWQITPIMLTGDPSSAACKLGERLGIDGHIGLLPEDKVNKIKDLQANNAVVLMVGDGINDAPVLAASDVSAAMNVGADLAQVASDGVIIADTLQPVVDAILIAKKSRHIIRQNLRWAFIYNSAVIIPAAMGYIPPWLAAIGMSLSSLFVVLNAMRIKLV